MAIDDKNRSLKNKIAVSYFFIFLAAALAIVFLYKGIQDLQLVDKASSSPNVKLERMNRIITLIYEAESQSRSYFLFRDTSNLNKYIKALDEIGKDIDTLTVICYANPDQVNRLNTIRTILLEKKGIIYQLIRMGSVNQKKMLYSRALEEIYIQAYELYNSPTIVRENITIRSDSIYLPQKKGVLQKIKNIFSESSDENEKVLSKVITQQSTRYDTIIQSGTTPDSVVKTLQQALDKMKLRENYQRDQNLSQETKLLHSDRILLNKIREIAKTLETEESANDKHGSKQLRSVIQKAVREVMPLALISFIVIVIFLFLIFRDITRSREQQLALQIAKQHAEDLTKMKEQFLANMSHEIRTPLSSIIGFTEQLQKTYLEPTQQQYLHTIEKSSDHLLSLVNDILDISKIDAGKLSLEKIRFNLAALLHEISHVFSLKAEEKNIELNCNINSGLNRDFISDPFRIRQVLINIVGNALKFTEQGSVTIEATIVSQRYTIINVKIAVTDTGIGISPEQQRVIFDEFSQADSDITRRYGGTGLGLAIAKKIVGLFNGLIYLSSVPGKGSTFTIEIPLEMVLSVQDSNIEQYPGPSLLNKIDLSVLNKLKGTKVLVVDDDETTLMLVSSLFTNMGIDGETSANVVAVPDMIIQKHYDIIFTDIQMPGMSGIELVKAIRSHAENKIAQLPVIALTANFNIKDDLPSGFTGYLLKPFKEADFYHKMIEVLFPEIHLPILNRAEQDQKIKKDAAPYSFEEISNFTVNDPEALKKVVHTFVEKSFKTIQDIKALAKQPDIDGISFCAHKLLPTFRQFKIYDAIGDLEKLERHKEINLPQEDFIAITQKVIETAEKIMVQIREESS
jgi:signal transduction histidine kinase/FixJ family two-component response regulator